MKQCKQCGEIKPIDEYYKKGTSLQAYCKPCSRSRMREYYRTNPDKFKTYKQKYHEADPQKRKEMQRRYYESHAADLKNKTLEYQKANPEKVNAKNRQWRESHKESLNQKQREKRAANRDVENERARLRRESNPEKRKETQRRYYARHRERILEKTRELKRQSRLADPEKRREQDRQYYAANREKCIASARKKDARRRSALEKVRCDFTAEQWKEKKRRYSNRCYYCGEKKPLTQDHVIPLSKGGEHTWGNILPACRNCNSSKSSRTVEEFLKSARSRTPEVV